MAAIVLSLCVLTFTDDSSADPETKTVTGTVTVPDATDVTSEKLSKLKVAFVSEDHYAIGLVNGSGAYSVQLLVDHDYVMKCINTDGLASPNQIFGQDEMSYICYRNVHIDSTTSSVDVILEKGTEYTDSQGNLYYLYPSGFATLVKLNVEYIAGTTTVTGSELPTYYTKPGQVITIPEKVNETYDVLFVGAFVSNNCTSVIAPPEGFVPYNQMVQKDMYCGTSSNELTIVFEGSVILNGQPFTAPFGYTGGGASTGDKYNFNIVFCKDVYVNSYVADGGSDKYSVTASSRSLVAVKSLTIGGEYKGTVITGKSTVLSGTPNSVRTGAGLANSGIRLITFAKNISPAEAAALQNTTIEKLGYLSDSEFSVESNGSGGYKITGGGKTYTSSILAYQEIESVSTGIGTIFFNTGEASPIVPIVCFAGETVVAPTNPAREAYSFTGWDSSIPETMPAGMTTLNAIFEPITYTFTFMNGTETVGTVEFNVENMASKTMPEVPAKTGYTGSWDVTEFTLENKTVNAVYEVITYTFTFMNGTETVGAVEFNVENMASKTMPEIPTKAGYTGSWDVTEFTLENKTVNAVYVKLVPVSENGTADVTLSDGETSFIPATGTKTVNVVIAADTSVKVEDAAGLADKVVVTKVDTVTNSTGIAGTAYEFTFTADGTVYNGKIQVTLPYTKEDGKEPVVYFWNGTESVKMKVISSTDTSVTFETDHNSMYVVASETPSKDDGSSFMLYLGIILVVGIVAAMLVGFTFYRKKA